MAGQPKKVSLRRGPPGRATHGRKNVGPARQKTNPKAPGKMSAYGAGTRTETNAEYQARLTKQGGAGGYTADDLKKKQVAKRPRKWNPRYS